MSQMFKKSCLLTPAKYFPVFPGRLVMKPFKSSGKVAGAVEAAGRRDIGNTALRTA